MAVYQEKARQRIKKGLRKFKAVAVKQRQSAVNEADTRLLVTAVLGELLGWDPFTEITGEHLIRGQYCDFAIKQDAGMFAIIEVKAAALDLSPKHLYQAVGYAANEGVDWVLLTNGAVWQLYRVLFEKPVSHDLVFEVSLLDEESTPAKKTELFYLISKEAQRAGELDAYYQKKAALCGANIARALLAPKVLGALRSEMRRVHGHNVSPEELATLLVQDVFRPDVQGDETARLILKAAAQKKAARVSSPSTTSAPGSTTTDDHLARMGTALRPAAQDLLDYVSGLGPEVTVKPMSSYVAVRTRRNFCCLEAFSDHLFVVLDLDPGVAATCAFARNVKGVGHHGTGDLQLRIEGVEQVPEAKELARRAYEESTG